MTVLKCASCYPTCMHVYSSGLPNMNHATHSQVDLVLQGMDTHSNILYVKENFPALSHLAHRTAATAKYRPETCCIIGNYYSLKAQHEKVGC